MAELTSERINKALRDIHVDRDGKLLTHINSCVRCGLCADSCIYYKANPDTKFIPAKKVELVSSVIKRYKTRKGRLLPRLAGNRKLEEKTIEEMVDLLFGSCTLCDRCTAHCSIGVDIGYLVRTGRNILANLGEVPESLQSTVDAAIGTGNNMAITHEEFVDTLEWLEEDLQMEVGDDNAAIPLDKPGKHVLYTLNPREPKFFPLSISAMAMVFYAAKESWTLSTRMYDVTNYAYFSGNMDEAEVIAQRLHDEMDSLSASRCILAECGHGSRAFRWEGPNYLKKPYSFDVLTSVELLAEYIREGRIKVNPEKTQEIVTLHDPCNLVRSGGVMSEQRYVLGKTVRNFVEMSPNGNDNLCCGGGGGQLAMSEYNERRMKIGELKAEQIRKTGAKIVATPCHNCVDQLTQLNVTFKLGVQIKTLAEIVADALVLEEREES